jgi:hypothetical protein
LSNLDFSMILDFYTEGPIKFASKLQNWIYRDSPGGAAEGLILIGGTDIINNLRKAYFRSFSSTYERKSIIDGVGEIDGEKDVFFLKRALNDEEVVMESAIKALGNIGSRIPLLRPKFPSTVCHTFRRIFGGIAN